MSIEQTLAERGNRYGDFADHAKIAQAIQDDMRIGEGWARLDDVKRQALTVIADKIARILSGDPNYADNWHDIQGYAKLVEDRLPVEMPADFVQQHMIEPASQIDDESPRQKIIQQGGEMAVEVYSAIDRMREAEAFNADLHASYRREQLIAPIPPPLIFSTDEKPISVEEAIALGSVPQREPCQPRHRCQTCAGGHATHECQAGT
jgi:hypothetical protein